MATAYKGQRFQKLRDKSLASGELFVDPEFPASSKSLFYSRIERHVEWMRPKELCKVPKLVSAGATCDDLQEGELGHCWWVSACSALTRDVALFEKVVVDQAGQLFSQNYAGIFHFRFFRFGSWVDVVVDDLLPVRNRKLVFCHSRDKSEFWSALLEKAYAKLYGDYESLKRGQTGNALVDLTGGVCEYVDLRRLREDGGLLDVFDELGESLKNGSMLVTNIECAQDEQGVQCRNGLTKGHGYGISQVRSFRKSKILREVTGSDSVQLIRLNNPWGTNEWTGAWSDDSKEWLGITAQEKAEMGIEFESEGDFWMSLQDFCDNFDLLDVCHFVNTTVFSRKKTWSGSSDVGSWTHGPRGSKNDRSGGPASEKSFLRNPQFLITVNDNGGDRLLVSLEQDDSNSDRKLEGRLNEIGFSVMQVEDNRKYRAQVKDEPVYTSEYTARRSVFRRMSLQHGRYVLVPTTAEAAIAGTFLLRVYSASSSGVKLLEKDSPSQPRLPCISQYAMVTSVTVREAVGLKAPPSAKFTFHVRIRCEGQTVTSCPAAYNDVNPAWYATAVFYRKKPSEPIVVELWSSRTLIDDFVSQATIEEDEMEDGRTRKLKLKMTGRKKEAEVEKPGEMHVEITSDSDITAL